MSEILSVLKSKEGYDMEDEIIACIDDKNIKYLHSGQISKYIYPLERSKAHKLGVGHLIIRFFIITITENSEIFYLVQKRSKNKKSFPGYYTDSASGHVLYRKNLTLTDIKKDAMRELEEEFGITKNKVKNIKFYGLNTEKNKDVTEIAYIFMGEVDSNIKIIPNKYELDVSLSQFYSKEELLSIINEEKSIDYSKKIWKELIEMGNKEKLRNNTLINKRRNDKNKIALFIGRFQPLHHGHIYIINYILKKYDIIKIGIGSSQLSNIKSDPFTEQERFAFIETAIKIRKLDHQKYSIYNIPDIFNAQKWVEHVLSIVGKFDVLYSNSDWVRELFLNKGFKVGKKLTIFKKKYNGTQIRRLISKGNKEWTRLVPREVVDLIRKFKGTERIRDLYLRD